MRKKGKRFLTAPTGRVAIREELFMMLKQLKRAREWGNLYLKEYKNADSDIGQKVEDAQEQINNVMNAVACVIGWDVLQKIEHQP